MSKKSMGSGRLVAWESRLDLDVDHLRKLEAEADAAFGPLPSAPPAPPTETSVVRVVQKQKAAPGTIKSGN